jgi:hypothetical protein
MLFFHSHSFVTSTSFTLIVNPTSFNVTEELGVVLVRTKLILDVLKSKL